nr:MAG TPA: hypothetical protein [Caudoviricetes sp.]
METAAGPVLWCYPLDIYYYRRQRAKLSTVKPCTKSTKITVKQCAKCQ